MRKTRTERAPGFAGLFVNVENALVIFNCLFKHFTASVEVGNCRQNRDGVGTMAKRGLVGHDSAVKVTHDFGKFSHGKPAFSVC